MIRSPQRIRSWRRFGPYIGTARDNPKGLLLFCYSADFSGELGRKDSHKALAGKHRAVKGGGGLKRLKRLRQFHKIRRGFALKAQCLAGNRVDETEDRRVECLPAEGADDGDGVVRCVIVGF